MTRRSVSTHRFIHDYATTTTIAPEAQNDLLVVVALARFSYEFEEADPELADRAWNLAVEYAHRQGLQPGEVINQAEW